MKRLKAFQLTDDNDDEVDERIKNGWVPFHVYAYRDDPEWVYLYLPAGINDLTNYDEE